MAIIASVTAGATISENEQIVAEKLNALGLPTVTLTGTIDPVDISDNAVTTDKIADGQVTDAKVKSDAAIAHSKLASLASLTVMAGSSTAVAAGHDIVGDVSVSRSTSLTFQFADAAARDATVVGDYVDIGVSFSGRIVKIGADHAGSPPYRRTVHVLPTGTPPASLPTSSVDIYRQPSTIVVQNTSATRPFNVGALIAGQTSGASAIVSACSSGVFSTPNYQYTLTLANIVGCFQSGEIIYADGSATTPSTSVAVGRSDIGGTYCPNSVCEYEPTTNTLALVSEVEDQEKYVDRTKFKTGSSDTAGKVLTSSGPFQSPTWETPLVNTPLARGGAMPFVPETWVGGSATAYAGTVNASAWEVQGWAIISGVGYVYLFNANFSTASLSGNKGEISVNDVLTFFPNAAATVQPFDTLQSIAAEEVGTASAYARYRVASVSVASPGSLTNVRAVTLQRVDDNTPVIWDDATYAPTTGTATAKGFAGRLAFSGDGASVFKCGVATSTGTIGANPPTAVGGTYVNGGAYVLLFHTPAAASTYAAHITASGQYDIDVAYGGATAAQYYGGWVTVRYRGTRRIMFDYMDKSGYTNEPRELSFTVYEQ